MAKIEVQKKQSKLTPLNRMKAKKIIEELAQNKLKILNRSNKCVKNLKLTDPGRVYRDLHIIHDSMLKCSAFLFIEMCLIRFAKY